MQELSLRPDRQANSDALAAVNWTSLGLQPYFVTMETVLPVESAGA
jgi:hypothetical protein